MITRQHVASQGRDRKMREAERKDGDAYANQGGGKLAGGNENSGHPANNVILSRDQNVEGEADHAGREARPAAAPGQDGTQAAANTKGSGMPVVSGAGQLADDRPGRSDPKTASRPPS